MTDFSNRTILITGANRGIGAATAAHFAALGAQVILAARAPDTAAPVQKAIEDAGGTARTVACDVAQPDSVAQAVRAALDWTGRLDVLVNNAGLIDPVARLADSDPTAWGTVVDVNLKGVYHGLRYALPVMAEQGQGTIINLSSGAATSALEGWSHYCATKAAVLSLTRVADKEYREKGVRVLGLSPGTVATRMQTQIRDSGINPVSQLAWSAHIPAEWVAKAIAYLATPTSDAHLGTDFSLKSDAGRAEAGLPAVAA